METKTLCPECLWPMTTDEDGTYCERCDSPEAGEPYTDEEMVAIRLAELKAEHPGAVIIKPSMVKAIDGKEYYNEMFIIAK